MEYLDVLDVNGRKTGRKKLRNEVHRDGDWHKAVHIYIMTPKNKVLIQKRSKVKDSYPGLWDLSSGGHIPFRHEAKETAVKELDEELGLKITKDDLKFLFKYYKERKILKNGNYLNNSHIDVFLVTKEIDLDTLFLQDGEVSGVKLINIKKFEHLIKSDDPTARHNPIEHLRILKIISKM